MKKNKIVKIFSVLFVLSMMASAFTGCAKKAEITPASGANQAAQTKEETKLDKIKKAGVLVLGTSADYPPYEFHKTINNQDKIVGFDISIAEQIAKDMGVKLEIKDMKFDGLLAALEAGNIDFVIAGMTPTEERKKSVDFSKVYYKSVQSIMVRTEDKDKYKTLDSFKGKKVGVQKGTTQEEIAKKELAGSELKALGKVTDLILELKNKKVDALVIELPVATSYASKNKDIVVSEAKVANEDKGSAIAVKKNSPEFLEAINKTLDKLMKDNSIDKFVTEANDLVE